jgi:hypothetical protein
MPLELRSTEPASAAGSSSTSLDLARTTTVAPPFILRAAKALGLQPVRRTGTGFARWVRARAALWL